MIWEKHKYPASLVDPTGHGNALPQEGFAFGNGSIDDEDDAFPNHSGSVRKQDPTLIESNNWRDVDHAVKMALALESNDAALFLQSLAGRKPSLYREVVWFLGAQEGLDGFMEAPVAKILPSFFQEMEPVSHLKTPSGEYPILDLLGEGGMGRVYLVEQNQALGRKVALKMLRGDLTEESHLARFENEYRLLAQLNHPHIAQVYEVGRTLDERPFFTMEYVAGIPIDQYCRKHKLSLMDRLVLFRKVCEAVAYAHERGVLHRDLKPSNILVANQNDRSIPKVIDFGIAKSTAAGQSLSSLHTRMDQLLGTPIYMSPEQIDRAVIDIDSRSDVYALGLLLHEILTGSPVMDPKIMADLPLHDALQVIAEKNHSLPSEKVRNASKEHLKKEFGNPKNSNKRIRTLRNDLDWIVAKAMAKNRKNRYSSVEALIGDIEAYLSHRPTHAHPWKRTYRLKKFVYRHRSEFYTGLLTALALISAFVIGLWLLNRMIPNLERSDSNEQSAGLLVIFAKRNCAPTPMMGSTMKIMQGKPMALWRSTFLGQKSEEKWRFFEVFMENTTQSITFTLKAGGQVWERYGANLINSAV